MKLFLGRQIPMYSPNVKNGAIIKLRSSIDLATGTNPKLTILRVCA
ncbi:MAG: hypothetical protein OXH31_09610 [Gammaproteobacteria bacterium]|nr:hypothetical protein [Gammaproteobacteria bacterium]